LLRSEPIGTLHFMRKRGEPAFGRRDLAAARAMARIVVRAVLSARQAAERRRERACLWAGVECASDAMVMRQDSSDVLYVNSAARRLIATVREGESLLSEAGREEGNSSRIVIPRSGRGPAFVKIRTHRASHDPSILVSVIEFVEGAPAPSSGARPLTRRELEVGELAARGLRVADIAEHLVLSPNTVKQHLKSCYAKLGVHSRVGLARQLA
jgi:DNA-binding CsgD family transcriptional regulator